MEYSDQGLAYDSDLESAALGSILVRPEVFRGIIAETKLQEQSFYLTKNQTVFKVILQLFEEGTPPSEELVSSHLNGAVPRGYVGNLAASVPVPSNLLHYAKRLVELEKWRLKRKASLKLLDATRHRNFDAFAKAKSELESGELHTNSVKTPEQLASSFRTYLEGSKSEAFKLPYKTFNERMAGGLRRKQMTILGGWSSHGKSVVIDQLLEYISLSGAKCHLYINEMGEEDRVARSISRVTGVDYYKLLQGKINHKESSFVDESLSLGCPYFSITECAGWSIHELAYDIKSRNYDVVGIDILHLFDYDSENELARISRLLNRTAKQNNCHIIATVHLNEYRVNDIIRPRPVTRDIRGSGMIKNDADNVMMIYREQDPFTGDPLPPASLYTCKVRNGQMGTVPMLFNAERFKFDEVM